MERIEVQERIPHCDLCNGTFEGPLDEVISSLEAYKVECTLRGYKDLEIEVEWCTLRGYGLDYDMYGVRLETEDESIKRCRKENNLTIRRVKAAAARIKNRDKRDAALEITERAELDRLTNKYKDKTRGGE